MIESRVLLAKLSFRFSERTGKTYCVGWLGASKLIGFPGELADADEVVATTGQKTNQRLRLASDFGLPDDPAGRVKDANTACRQRNVNSCIVVHGRSSLWYRARTSRVSRQLTAGVSHPGPITASLKVRRFDTVEELRPAPQALRQTYNQTWIIERHGYRTPAQVRADHQLGRMPMAA